MSSSRMAAASAATRGVEGDAAIAWPAGDVNVRTVCEHLMYHLSRQLETFEQRTRDCSNCLCTHMQDAATFLADKLQPLAEAYMIQSIKLAVHADKARTDAEKKRRRDDDDDDDDDDKDDDADADEPAAKKQGTAKPSLKPYSKRSSRELRATFAKYIEYVEKHVRMAHALRAAHEASMAEVRRLQVLLRSLQCQVNTTRDARRLPVSRALLVAPGVSERATSSVRRVDRSTAAVDARDALAYLPAGGGGAVDRYVCVERVPRPNLLMPSQDEQLIACTTMAHAWSPRDTTIAHRADVAARRAEAERTRGVVSLALAPQK